MTNKTENNKFPHNQVVNSAFYIYLFMNILTSNLERDFIVIILFCFQFRRLESFTIISLYIRAPQCLTLLFIKNEHIHFTTSQPFQKANHLMTYATVRRLGSACATASLVCFSTCRCHNVRTLNDLLVNSVHPDHEQTDPGLCWSYFSEDLFLFIPRKHLTSLQRRCNVTTLQRRCNDVDATLYACWVEAHLVVPLSFLN